MKNYKDLDIEYQSLVLDYENNGNWITDYQDAIYELVREKSIVINTLINEMLECKRVETEAKIKLLAANFTEQEIRTLAYQCYQTMKD